MLTPHGHPIQHWLQRQLWQYPQHSRAYRQWRQEFVRDRLIMAFWIAIVAQILLKVVDFLLVIPFTGFIGAEAQSKTTTTLILENLLYLTVSLMGLGIILGILNYSQHSSRARQNQSAIYFLPWFSICILIFPSQLDWLIFKIPMDGGIIGSMAIVLWCQALLVPVQWRVHLFSHALIVLNVVCIGLPTLSEPVNKIDQETLLLGVVWVVIYSLMIIAIANFIVAYSERLLWREFHLREQLQIFLGNVSENLRDPILASQSHLQQIQLNYLELSPRVPSIYLSKLTTQLLLDNSYQQLSLLASLLAVHHPED